MKHINQRNIKITSELMSFCYKYQCQKININVETIENETFINLTAEVFDMNTSTLELVKKLLNTPRCHEMEEYYWSLTGDDDTDSELTLVGIMIDEAEIVYTDNKLLQINLKRKL